MKENIILFIIIGFFLITLVFFNHKEGFTATTESTEAYSALAEAKAALTAASSSSPADFTLKFGTANTAITNLKTKATAFNSAALLSTASDAADIKATATLIYNAANSISSSFTSATTDDTKATAITSAITALNAIPAQSTSGSGSGSGSVSGSVVSGSGSGGTPLGDTCANKTALTTTNCEWNSNPADNSDWWNEHRMHPTETINNIKWNTHTVEIGDFTKYKNCYRNPTADKTTGLAKNGVADQEFIVGYLMDREKEAMEERTSSNNYKRIQSSYDISFSNYKSILENNARMITSINDEKERYKRDISNASTRPSTSTVYSDDYEYYYEEEGPDGSTCPSLKCIADFGTNVGENLCCGQTGVLQNTQYVCPSVKPTCKNFKCGSKFGTCV